MKFSNIFLFVLLVATNVPAWAKTDTTGIEITDAWARATFPGQQMGAAYMKIKSDKPASLVKVETPSAKRAEIHTMYMKEGVMIMRELDSFDLPEGQTVQFSKGGHHIMLVDLKQALKAGDKVPLKLSIERGGETVTIEVMAEVRKK